MPVLPHGAGARAAEQQQRERLRLEAAGRFARSDGIGEIAHDLRVTEGSMRRWHRAWQEGRHISPRQSGKQQPEPLRNGSPACEFLCDGWRIPY